MNLRGRDSMSKVGGLGVHEVHKSISYHIVFNRFDPLASSNFGGAQPPPVQKVGGGAQAPLLPQVLCL